MSKKIQNTVINQNGWATLELLLLLPIVVALFSLIAFFTQIAIVQLHITNATTVAMRKLAGEEIPKCAVAKKIVKEIFDDPELHQNLDINCNCDVNKHEIMSVNVVYHYESKIPIFDLLKKDIKSSSYAIREK